MQNQTIQQKQAYLRKQIIDNDYDPNDFVEYLQTIREDGADVNSWKLTELKEVVNKYIALKNQQLRQNVAQQVVKDRIFSNTVQKTIKTKEIQKKQQHFGTSQKRNSLFVKKLSFERYNISQKQFTKRINVQIFKKFINKEIIPEIIVQKPELLVTGGLFGIATTTTIWFTMKNNILTTTVKRKDQDFFWLRNQLIKIYPGSMIPPLKSPKSNYEKQDLNKRCWMINFFMNSLFKNQILFNNKLVISFISWTDYENFSKLKDQINSQNIIRSLNNVISVEGLVELEFSQKNADNVKKLQKFSQNISEIYTKMKEEIRIFIKNFHQKASTILRVGQNFGKIQESYSNLIGSAPQFFNIEFNNTIINLNNIMIQWGNKVLIQKQIIDKHIGNFFKACKQQIESMRQLLKRRSDAEEQFLKFKTYLAKKKQRIYPEFQKWELPANLIVKIKQPEKLKKQQAFEIMLPKQSEQEKNLKQWNGYLNKCCQNQFLNLCSLTAKHYEKSFTNLGKAMNILYRNEADIVERFSLFVT